MSGAEGFTAVFMIQMILVAYLYVRVGKGKYWHTLLAVAIAGICGKTIENLGQVLVCYFLFNFPHYSNQHWSKTHNDLKL